MATLRYMFLRNLEERKRENFEVRHLPSDPDPLMGGSKDGKGLSISIMPTSLQLDTYWPLCYLCRPTFSVAYP